MRIFAVFSVLFTLGIAACDSDDGEQKDDAADDLKEDASSADDAALNDAAPADDTGSGADDGGLGLIPDAGVPVQFVGEGVPCGDTRCRNVAVGGELDLEVEGCCADDKASLCGLNLKGIGPLLGLSKAGCEPLDLPGSEDEACSASGPIAIAFGPEEGLVLPGCCRETGTCGYSTSISGIGFGCVDPERFAGEEAGAECDYQAE